MADRISKEVITMKTLLRPLTLFSIIAVMAGADMPAPAALLDMRPPITPSSSSGLVIAGVLLAAAIFFLGRWLWNRRLKKNESARNV